jgi:hypothetical protein
MHRPGTHIPQDRLRALSRGDLLPCDTYGSAIFANIPGFTPLTEKLTQTPGPRKGMEVLSRPLNAVSWALIDHTNARHLQTHRNGRSLSTTGQFQAAVTMLAASNQVAKSIGIKIEPELQDPYDKRLPNTGISGHEFQSVWMAAKK